MKRAGHLAAVAAADRDIAEIMSRKTQEDSLSNLFPDIYSRFVEKTIDRRSEAQARASAEAAHVAAATVRAGMVERSWRAELEAVERKEQEVAGLEAVERKLVEDGR